MDKSIVEYLENIAKKQTSSEKDEEFWSTGNYDTSYYMGIEDGEINLARAILNKGNAGV